jgi:hypothetical protein
VAVSEIEPPSTTDPDAWVVNVGAAATTMVVAEALLFSESESFEDVAVATFV